VAYESGGGLAHPSRLASSTWGRYHPASPTDKGPVRFMKSPRLLYHRALSDRHNARVLAPYAEPTDHPVLVDTPAYARKGTLSRMFFMEAQNLFYQRLPKCANSTICRTFAAHAGVTRQDDEGRLAKNMFHRIPTPAQFDGARKVVFLRDPVTRALSGWRDKALGGNLQARYGLTGDASGKISFLSLLQALADNDYFQNAHFIPQVHLIPGDISDYTVGVIEDLDAAMRPICEAAFGRYDGLAQRESGRTGSSAKSVDLSAEERDLIAHLYADDIALHAAALG